MFEVTVTGTFTATHALRYPDGSREDPHEHEWHVRVRYTGPALDDTGLLLDFVPLRRRLDEILAGLAGGPLESRAAFADQNASAEHVAAHIAGQLPAAFPRDVRLESVEVEEEAGCFARFLPDVRR
jgi:6-pyruvoyl-tetrahydropterin synthase